MLSGLTCLTDRHIGVHLGDYLSIRLSSNVSRVLRRKEDRLINLNDSTASRQLGRSTLWRTALESSIGLNYVLLVFNSVKGSRP